MTETVFNESPADEPAGYAPLEQAAYVPPPGSQLASRRQEMNLTVEQVANQLNLAPRQIQALESDNYGALPGMASVRGFIRAYAKLLKMDAAPLVQAIAHEVTAAHAEPLGPALSTTPFSDGRSSLTGRRFPVKWVIGVLLACALVGAVLAAQRMGWLSNLSPSFALKDWTLWPNSGSREAEPETASAPADTAEKEPAEKGTTSTTVLPNAIPAVAAVPVKPEPAPQAKVETPVKTEAAPAPVVAAPAKPPAAAAAVAVTAAPAVPAAAAVIDPAAKDMLVIKLRQDSWIDVRRPDNTPVVSRLARAGEIEAVKVNGPLALTIGNAAGVNATLRGKAIELQTEARSNVARLSLK